MLTKVHGHARYMYDAYLKLVTTLERSVKGYGDCREGRAKRQIGGLGPRAVVRGLKIFWPPKSNLV